MFLKKSDGPRVVRLPDGGLMSVGDLPDGNTRWVASRKADVVRAVAAGLLTREEALARYRLSEEEFGLWSRYYASGGVGRLKIAAIAGNRDPEKF